MKLSRRDVLRVSGTSTVAAAALALSSRGPRSAHAQDPARIRAAGFVESQEQLQHTLDVLKLYDEKHPDIEISAEFTDYSSYVDKLATEAAGGNAPDMLSANGTIMGEYSRRGVLRPLDEFVPDPIDLSDYAEGTVLGNKVDGKLYGFPNDCIATAIMYNTAVFEETGIEVPDQMWTWEEFAQTANDISQAKGEDFYGTEDAGGSALTCDLYFRGRGKEFYTADRGLGFDEADLTAWLEFWQALRESGGAPPADIQALSDADDLTRTGLIAGRAAMLPQLTDTYFGLQSLTEDELGLHLLPNGFEGEPLVQQHYAYAGNSTSISSQSDHVETVVDIVQFMQTDPEGVAIFYRGSGLVPASKRGRERLREEGTPGEQRVLDFIELILEDSAPPRNPSVPGVNAILGRVNEQIAFGQISVDEGVEQFFDEAATKLQ